MENAGEETEFCEELGERLPISDWLDGIETAEQRKYKRVVINYERDIVLDKRPPELRHADKNQIIRFKDKEIEIQQSAEKYKEQKQRKEVLDGKAEVWKRFICWGIGFFITIVFVILICWGIYNLDWIENNAGILSIFVGVLALLLAVFPSLWRFFMKEKLTVDTPIKWIEEKVKKRMYKKSDGFDIAEFENTKLKIKQEENELITLKR